MFTCTEAVHLPVKLTNIGVVGFCPPTKFSLRTCIPASRGIEKHCTEIEMRCQPAILADCTLVDMSLSGDEGQIHCEASFLVRNAFRLDLALMKIDNCLDRRQPQPCAGDRRFCRVIAAIEALEYMGHLT